MDVENALLFQFADDLCVVAWGKSMTDVTEMLQRAINQLMILVSKTNVTVNSTKTKAVWFNSEYELHQPVVRIRGEKIKFETDVRYLGIYIDEKLNFQRHIRELLAVVEKRLNVLRMLAGSKWGGHPDTLLTALKSVVRGKIDYGSTIYANSSQKWLNKISVSYNKVFGFV